MAARHGEKRPRSYSADQEHILTLGESGRRISFGVRQLLNEAAVGPCPFVIPD